MSDCRCMRQHTEGLLLAQQVLAGFAMSGDYCMYLHDFTHARTATQMRHTTVKGLFDRCWCIANYQSCIL